MKQVLIDEFKVVHHAGFDDNYRWGLGAYTYIDPCSTMKQYEAQLENIAELVMAQRGLVKNRYENECVLGWGYVKVKAYCKRPGDEEEHLLSIMVLCDRELPLGAEEANKVAK